MVNYENNSHCEAISIEAKTRQSSGVYITINRSAAKTN